MVKNEISPSLAITLSLNSESCDSKNTVSWLQVSHEAMVEFIHIPINGTIQRLFNLNTSDSEIMISEQSDWSVI